MAGMRILLALVVAAVVASAVAPAVGGDVVAMDAAMEVVMELDGIEDGGEGDLLIEDCGAEDECSEGGSARAAAAAASNGTDAAESEVAEELVDDVLFEDITGNLTILKPANGSEVEGNAVAVHLNVATNCPNATRFEDKFNTSHVCISLDDSDFSCWPIFGLSRYPLYTNLTAGAHTLVSKLVDPATGLDLIDESVARSTFFMTPKPEEPERTPEEKAAKDDDDEEGDDDEPEESSQETIQIPQVGIEYPLENGVVSRAFEVRLHIMTSANLTQFRRLFEESFICLSLDSSKHKSCWPIFEEKYYPRFFNLEPGRMHTLVAHLSHPNTLEVIAGTEVGVRNFWVAEPNSGFIPMQLHQPSVGSNAFAAASDLQAQAQAQAQAAVQVTAEQLDDRTETKEDEPQPLAPLPDVPVQEANTAAASKSVEPDATAVAAAQVAQEARQAETARADKAKAKGKAGSFVTLSINVDHVTHVLKVGESEDFVSAAARFCMAQNIIGQSCVNSITDLIETEWQRFNHLPHIELYSTVGV